MAVKDRYSDGLLGADLTAKAWKEGYAEKQVPVHMYLNLPYLGGNIIFGGLIGWVIVDPITGAMFSFPESVNVVLTEAE